MKEVLACIGTLQNLIKEILDFGQKNFINDSFPNCFIRTNRDYNVHVFKNISGFLFGTLQVRLVL